MCVCALLKHLKAPFGWPWRPFIRIASHFSQSYLSGWKTPRTIHTEELQKMSVRLGFGASLFCQGQFWYFPIVTMIQFPAHFGLGFVPLNLFPFVHWENWTTRPKDSTWVLHSFFPQSSFGEIVLNTVSEGWKKNLSIFQFLLNA